MYNRTITIQFHFPLENLRQTIHFQAQATIYKDFCLVYGFHTLGDNKMGKILSDGSDMPRMILHPVLADGKLIYVHKDSGKQTLMSQAIGDAIEDALHKELTIDG